MIRATREMGTARVSIKFDSWNPVFSLAFFGASGTVTLKYSIKQMTANTASTAKIIRKSANICVNKIPTNGPIAVANIALKIKVE